MIVISNVCSNRYWEKLFKMILEECNAFQVVFPNGEVDPENPLMGGKDFFQTISTKVTVSNIMDDASEYNGSLNEEIRQKFILYMKSSFIGEKPLLWYFRLLKDEKVYLTCEDFSVCILEENEGIK